MRTVCFSAVVMLGLALASCSREPVSDTPSKDSSLKAADTGVAGPPASTRLDTVHKYGVKSGIVTYENSLTSAPEMLYFDEFGAVEAYYSQVPKTAVDGRGANVTIYKDGWMSIYSVTDRIGEKHTRPMPTGPIVGAIPDVWNMPKESWPSYKVQELPAKTLLGHEAQGYAFEYNGSHTVWLWEGIPLYLESHRPQLEGAENALLKATSITTDIEIPPARFAVPSGIRITERKRPGK